MESLQALKQLVSLPKDVVITTHRNPDGDAIGSSLALYHYLRKNGHTVHILVPSEYPAFLAWMDGVDDIVVYDIDPDRCKELLDRCNLFFALDFNGLDRIDKLGQLVDLTGKDSVMIDHHLYPDDFVDHLFSDTSYSSTCELLYDVLKGIGAHRDIDPLIAECLFVGILTDTGGFKYATSARLFRTAADLVDLGVDDYQLQDRIFNSLTEKNLRLLGHCLANRMEILPEFRTGIITLTKEDYDYFDIKRGDTEGIVNYLLKMPGIVMAAFIHEQPKITKLSLRSKREFSVQEIAQKYFRGGGHKNASGGASYSGLGNTVRKFKSILPEFKEKLDKA